MFFQTSVSRSRDSSIPVVCDVSVFAKCAPVLNRENEIIGQQRLHGRNVTCLIRRHKVRPPLHQGKPIPGRGYELGRPLGSRRNDQLLREYRRGCERRRKHLLKPAASGHSQPLRMAAPTRLLRRWLPLTTSSDEACSGRVDQEFESCAPVFPPLNTTE